MENKLDIVIRQVKKVREIELNEIKEVKGNIGLLQLEKTAFLCSRKIPASAVLKCYDWAVAQRDAGNCVISGFHSQIEKDVLHYLLKGRQPIIVSIARGIKERIEPEFIKPIEEGRLLIISPFIINIKRVTKETATIRNQFMIELADNIVIGHLNPNGQLASLVKSSGRNYKLL